MVETKRTWSIEAGERVKIVAPNSTRLGQRATVISPHTGEFVFIEFGDGATGCWHCGELEILGEGE
jgi:hypothetical protein